MDRFLPSFSGGMTDSTGPRWSKGNDLHWAETQKMVQVGQAIVQELQELLRLWTFVAAFLRDLMEFGESPLGKQGSLDLSICDTIHGLARADYSLFGSKCNLEYPSTPYVASTKPTPSTVDQDPA